MIFTVQNEPVDLAFAASVLMFGINTSINASRAALPTGERKGAAVRGSGLEELRALGFRFLLKHGVNSSKLLSLFSPIYKVQKLPP